MATCMEDRIVSLVDWMRERAAEAHARGGVFGVSGGVDSALILALSKKAWPDDSLGLVLPCHSLPEDAEDAIYLLDLFQCPYEVVDLTGTYDALVRVLAAGPDAAKMSLARANLKPRLRMLTWCYYANLTGRIVVGGTNRDEWHVGYFTKHGDSGVDIMPLAALTKGEVKAMARHLGVPDRIVGKPPTAGLWPGQTDEDEMGILYEHIDAYLLGEEVPAGAKEKIESRHRSSVHKRRTPPFPNLG